MQGKCSHNQQEAEIPFQGFKAQIFMLQAQTNLFLSGKNVLIVMGPILINKDVFEPSYNDLKLSETAITLVPT